MEKNIETTGTDEALEIVPINYDSLTKAQLIKLCEDKDAHIESYETERTNFMKHHEKELNNMNDYYVNKIKELNKVIKYYNRKNKLIINMLTLESEKEEEK